MQLLAPFSKYKNARFTDYSVTTQFVSHRCALFRAADVVIF